MLVCYPTKAFERMDSRETAVFDAATKLTRVFESMLVLIQNGRGFASVPHDVSMAFGEALMMFSDAFKVWKEPDQIVFIARVKEALLKLYEAQAQLPPDEPANSPLHTEFRIAINQLETQLRACAGEQAFVEFQESRLDENIRNDTAPPTWTLHTSRRLTNEEICYQLMYDPDFRLTDDNQVAECYDHELKIQTRQGYSDKFWRGCVDELKRSVYTRLLRCLTEVHVSIVELDRGNVISDVGKIIDVDKIRAWTSLGTFDKQKRIDLVSRVVEAVEKLQEPGRVEETKSGWSTVSSELQQDENQEVALCNAIRFLLDRMTKLRLDFANSRYISLFVSCIQI